VVKVKVTSVGQEEGQGRLPSGQGKVVKVRIRLTDVDLHHIALRRQITPSALSLTFPLMDKANKVATHSTTDFYSMA